MKILLLKNNISDSTTLSKGIELVKEKCASINLSLDFTIKDTKKQFTSIPVTNDSIGNGYSVNPIEIFQEAKGTGLPFEVALLIYDWSTISPQPTNPCDNGMSIQIPMQWYADHPEVFCEFLLHELCHYYFAGSGQLDITHDQQKYPEWQQKQPTDYYLHLLTPFVPTASPQPLTATLKRVYGYPQETVGELTSGSFSCRTLELPWLLNEKNISCIPKGTYKVKYTFSLSKLGWTYEIQNVPGRSGIRMHSGNSFHDIEGCILFGDSYADINNDKIPDIINSQITKKAFETYMGKKDFILTII